MTHSSEDGFKSFTVTLPRTAYDLADQFAREQSDLEKKQQSFFKILAVKAVYIFCELMEIQTKQEANFSLNPMGQSFRNVGDLQVINIGKLHCLPVLPDAKYCYLPQEVSEEQICYVFVEIDESRKAKVLGFLPIFDILPEQIMTEDIRTLDDFLSFIGRLESVTQFLRGDDSVAVKVRAHLGNIPIYKIAFQLERVYSNCRDSDQLLYAVEEVLSGTVGSSGSKRGPGSDGENLENDFFEIAEELRDKLAVFWVY